MYKQFYDAVRAETTGYSSIVQKWFKPSARKCLKTILKKIMKDYSNKEWENPMRDDKNKVDICFYGKKYTEIWTVEFVNIGDLENYIDRLDDISFAQGKREIYAAKFFTYNSHLARITEPDGEKRVHMHQGCSTLLTKCHCEH